MCTSLCAPAGTVFSFPLIKGAINFPLLPLSECNTRTAGRLGPDPAGAQAQLIYPTPASVQTGVRIQRMTNKVSRGGGRRGREKLGRVFILRNSQ